MEIDDIDGFDGDKSEGERPVELDANVTSQKSDLFLYKADCLKCSHLVKIESLNCKPFRCTIENGNTRCPASVIQISTGVNVEVIAAAIHDAHVKMDLAKYAKRIARLSKYPVSVQRTVMDRVQEMSLAG